MKSISPLYRLLIFIARKSYFDKAIIFLSKTKTHPHEGWVVLPALVLFTDVTSSGKFVIRREPESRYEAVRPSDSPGADHPAKQRQTSCVAQ
ncbi:MAG TPA: hypothetical protein ENO22_13000 [candidate division Zixibacteria bacterium]|nr:hypothetical protein [candidate division Zixibacteria bacterium]